MRNLLFSVIIAISVFHILTAAQSDSNSTSAVLELSAQASSTAQNDDNSLSSAPTSVIIIASIIGIIVLAAGISLLVVKISKKRIQNHAESEKIRTRLVFVGNLHYQTRQHILNWMKSKKEVLFSEVPLPLVSEIEDLSFNSVEENQPAEEDNVARRRIRSIIVMIHDASQGMESGWSQKYSGIIDSISQKLDAEEPSVSRVQNLQHRRRRVAIFVVNSAGISDAGWSLFSSEPVSSSDRYALVCKRVLSRYEMEQYLDDMTRAPREFFATYIQEPTTVEVI